METDMVQTDFAGCMCGVMNMFFSWISKAFSIQVSQLFFL